MPPWAVGAVVIAIVLLAMAVWLVRRSRHVAPLEDAAAQQAAGAALPGFIARHALIADDRRTALVVGDHARVALVTATRRQPLVREVRWNEIRAVAGGLRVEAERGPAVLVPGIDVLDVRRAGDETWRRR